MCVSVCVCVRVSYNHIDSNILDVASADVHEPSRLIHIDTPSPHPLQCFFTWFSCQSFQTDIYVLREIKAIQANSGIKITLTM